MPICCFELAGTGSLGTTRKKKKKKKKKEKKKEKMLSLCLIQHHSMKAYGGM